MNCEKCGSEDICLSILCDELGDTIEIECNFCKSKCRHYKYNYLGQEVETETEYDEYDNEYIEQE